VPVGRLLGVHKLAAPKRFRIDSVESLWAMACKIPWVFFYFKNEHPFEKSSSLDFLSKLLLTVARMIFFIVIRLDWPIFYAKKSCKWRLTHFCLQLFCNLCPLFST
jgi:hypothetical protein